MIHDQSRGQGSLLDAKCQESLLAVQTGSKNKRSPCAPMLNEFNSDNTGCLEECCMEIAWTLRRQFKKQTRRTHKDAYDTHFYWSRVFAKKTDVSLPPVAECRFETTCLAAALSQATKYPPTRQNRKQDTPSETTANTSTTSTNTWSWLWSLDSYSCPREDFSGMECPARFAPTGSKAYAHRCRF